MRRQWWRQLVQRGPTSQTFLTSFTFALLRIESQIEKETKKASERERERVRERVRMREKKSEREKKGRRDKERDKRKDREKGGEGGVATPSDTCGPADRSRTGGQTSPG